MAAGLIIATWAGLFGVFRRYRVLSGWRECLGASGIAMFLLCWLVTESLSALHAIRFWPMVFSWAGLCGISLLSAFAFAGRPDTAARQAEMPAARPFLLQHRHWTDWTLLLILVITLVTALMRPPNTWDSMTYHMARVATWIQNGTLAFFPTAIERQNYAMPLAEYVILNLQVLSQSDRLANLVQWAAYALSIVLVSLLARSLGLDRKIQKQAALLAALVPMALLQSTSTQNDLVTGFLVMAFAWTLLELIRKRDTRWVVLCGASLGLALLVKGTAYLYCGALGLALGIFSISQGQWRKQLVKFAPVYAYVVLIAVAINLPHLGRNLSWSGHVFSQDVRQGQLTERVSFGAVAASIAKNAAIHLSTPSEELNSVIEDFLVTSFGSEITDRQTNFNDTRFVLHWQLDEDVTGNTLHFAMIVLGMLALTRAKLARPGETLALTTGLLLAVLISAVSIPWQPWGSRLHLPLFLLSIPVAAAGLTGRKRDRHKALLPWLAAALLLSIPFLLRNPMAPLVGNDEPSLWASGRTDLYFAKKRNERTDWHNAATYLKRQDPAAVGMALVEDDWEYALKVLTGRHANPGTPVFIHLAPARPGPEPRFGGVQPEFVVSTRAQTMACLQGFALERVLDQHHVDVYAVTGVCSVNPVAD